MRERSQLLLRLVLKTFFNLAYLIFFHYRHCTSINWRVHLYTTRLLVKSLVLERQFWDTTNRHRLPHPLRHRTHMEIWTRHRMDHCTTLIRTDKLPLCMAGRRPDSCNSHKQWWCRPLFKAHQQVQPWQLMLVAATCRISTTIYGRDHRQLPFLVVLNLYAHNSSSSSSNSQVQIVIVRLIQGMDIIGMGTRNRSNLTRGCIQRNKQISKWTTLPHILCTRVLLLFRLDLLTITTVNSMSLQQPTALPLLQLLLLRDKDICEFLFLPRRSQTLVLQVSESNFIQHPHRVRHIRLLYRIPMGIPVRIIPDKAAMQAGWGCVTESVVDPVYNRIPFSSPLFIFSYLGVFFCVSCSPAFVWHVNLRRQHPYVNLPILQSQTDSEQLFYSSSSTVHKQFIVIIITTQHTYYYNHSSPYHWHFSFALSFHFIPLFRLPHLNTILTLGVFFFCNQSSAAITLIFDPFLFW